MTTTSIQPAQTFSKPLQAFAQVISWLVHPLFIPAAIAAVILFIHPINMLMIPHETRVRIMAMVMINTILFPAALVFLLWRLRFLKSIYMETTKERIIPLTVSLLFYFWAFYVGRNLDVIPHSLQQWLLGVFLASSLAMFINIWIKVSLHSIALGGLVGFCAWQQATDIQWPYYLLIPCVLLAGLVGTARLIRGAHEPSELYIGYVAGILCQVVAGWVLS